MINKIKQEKGITLVALIITVMIMAILIGILVKVSTDDNLVERTQNVADNYQEARVEQAIKTILVSERSLYEDGFINEVVMWENIKESIQNNDELTQYGEPEMTETSDGLQVKIGVYSYKITKDSVEKM